MGIPFKLPDVGEGVAEAEVIRWLVKEGEKVSADQPVVEVQTDKAVVELPSPTAGEVEMIRWREGDTVPVGEVLLEIRQSEDGKTEAAATAEAVDRPPSNNLSEAKRKRRRRVLAAPSTRRLARNLAVDLHQVTGTGAKGQVTKEDVRRVAAALAESRGEVSSASHLIPKPVKPPVPSPPPLTGSGTEEKSGGQAEAFSDEPLSRTRRVIAERLLFSVTRKPHATHFDELNVEGLARWQTRLKAQASEREPRIGYLPILLKAIAASLKWHPKLNAHFDEEKQQVRRFNPVSLGVAVDTAEGLLVPVLREADQKSIRQIAAELKELTHLAREGRLAPEQMKGSTFTVSNTGSLGGRFATPIIHPPEVAILALHPVEQRPVVEDGQLTAGWRMNVSLSFDHRVLDGADAIRFTQTLATFLTDPGNLFLELS